MQMDFKTAVMRASANAELTRSAKEKLATFQGTSHPRLLAACEHVAAHRYERATGKRLPTVNGQLDWSKAWQWLIDNLPALLKLFAAFLL